MHGGMNEQLWLSHGDEMRPQVDLQRRIWEELHRDLEADTSDVSVWVEDFVARLGGSVSSYPARIAVEHAAERVRGVGAVVNELRVVLSAAACRPDNALAAAVANALEWDSRVPHVGLTVRVVDGWVALAGSVECQCQRVAAEATISHLTGIRGVTNAIVIEPPPVRADLADRALTRHV